MRQQTRVKVHPKAQRGSRGISSTLSLTLALDRVGGQLHAPAALPPRKRPGTHCIGGWMGPRAGLDGCEKSRSHRIFFFFACPGFFSLWSIFVLFKSFRPSCHFTFHTTVLTTNTTQTSMPPVGFFFCLSGVIAQQMSFIYNKHLHVSAYIKRNMRLKPYESILRKKLIKIQRGSSLTYYVRFKEEDLYVLR
jgi:hypothetical protein